MELVIHHSPLNHRTFPRLKCHKRLSPGYHDSPEPSKGVAMLCLETKEPGKRPSQTPQGHAEAVEGLVRSKLWSHCGYECSVPHPGSFLLAFCDLPSALRFAAEVQLEGRALLPPAKEGRQAELPPLLPVPSHLRSPSLTAIPPLVVPCHRESQEQMFSWEQSVRIGIAFGHPPTRKPLKTGRATYAGPLPNLAVRVMAMAQPGKAVVDGSPLVSGGNRVPAEKAVVMESGKEVSTAMLCYCKEDAGEGQREGEDQTKGMAPLSSPFLPRAKRSFLSRTE